MTPIVLSPEREAHLRYLAEEDRPISTGCLRDALWELDAVREELAALHEELQHRGWERGLR
jgi:hypothetical protein